MFSGIIEEQGVLVAIHRGGNGHLVVRSTLDHSDSKLGDSIAINGVCLTLVKKEEELLTFDISEETIRRTTFSFLQAGAKVNLERALLLGSRIHGHFVYGHVDGVIRLKSKETLGASQRLVWEITPEQRRYIVEKGSVALSGVSLTVAEVTASTFSIYVIPHTLEKTTLSDIRVGEAVNLEFDMLARYVMQPDVGVTEGFLRENGYWHE